MDRDWFCFFVTLLNRSYWVTGATLSGLVVSFITVEIKGIDFVMTALFVVIFLEQWLKETNHFTSLIGLVVPTISLIILGADYFVIPAMAAINSYSSKPTIRYLGLLFFIIIAIFVH